MNKTLDECRDWATSMFQKFRHRADDTLVVVAPPYSHLVWLSEFFKSRELEMEIAAQNCYHEEKGAYTGEVSAAMVKSTGANYVIIGHSERRAYCNEDNQLLAKKIAVALKNDLIAVYCVGESLEEKESHKQLDVVKLQLLEALSDFSAEELKNIIIAYEPVWAIGTGKNATSAQAQEMHAYIRSVVAEKWGADVAKNISILYGGSCNAENAKELFACADVDGGLIGGASLNVDTFIKIANSFPA